MNNEMTLVIPHIEKTKTIMKARSDVTTSKRAPEHGPKPVLSLFFLRVMHVVSQLG